MVLSREIFNIFFFILDFSYIQKKQFVQCQVEKKQPFYFTKSVFEKINDLDDTKYLILIGKDGQVKNSYSSKNKLENIFYDVDRMPMRKYEMETRKQ